MRPGAHSRSPPCRGRSRRPSRSRWAPARHVSSAPARTSSSSRYGAVVATIPGAPWHHWSLISPVRWCSRPSPAAGGQFARPPSRTTSRDSTSFVSASSRSARSRSSVVRSAWTLPTRPCTGPRDLVSLNSRCVQSPSVSRRASSASALSRHASRQRSSPVRVRGARVRSGASPASPTSARRARPRGHWRGRGHSRSSARSGPLRQRPGNEEDTGSRRRAATTPARAGRGRGRRPGSRATTRAPRARQRRKVERRTRRGRAAAARRAPRRHRARRRRASAPGVRARPECQAGRPEAAAARTPRPRRRRSARSWRARDSRPRLVRDRLEVLRPEEHQASRRSLIAFRSSARILSIRRSSSSSGSCSAWM